MDEIVGAVQQLESDVHAIRVVPDDTLTIAAKITNVKVCTHYTVALDLCLTLFSFSVRCRLFLLLYLDWSRCCD